MIDILRYYRTGAILESETFLLLAQSIARNEDVLNILHSLPIEVQRRFRDWVIKASDPEYSVVKAGLGLMYTDDEKATIRKWCTTHLGNLLGGESYDEFLGQFDGKAEET